MPLADYAHHNEEAAHIWWQEEGRFESAPMDHDDFYDRYDGPYCACEDGDDSCEFTVDEEDARCVWRTCMDCGNGEGAYLSSLDQPSLPEYKKDEIRRWARLAGVSL